MPFPGHASVARRILSLYAAAYPLCVPRPEATLCGDTVNTAAAHFGVHRGARPLVAVWMSSHLKERLLFA